MIESPLTELAAPLRAAVARVGGNGATVQLERPADAAHGDYASAVALGLARPLRAAPREIASQLAPQLSSPWIEAVEVAGPGFINLRVGPAFHRHVVSRVLAEGARYGSGAAPESQRIQVEYVSGNPTGPVTAATARNAAYGDSLARLFTFAGHTVEREYYFNDAGRQMELFGSRWAPPRGEPAPEGGYEGAYIHEIAARWACRRTPRPTSGSGAAPTRWWPTSSAPRAVQGLFDSWFLERSLYEDGSVDRAIERVRAAGHTYERDGALWLRSTEFGDDKDRVVLRSDGTPTYIAGDIAYIVSKLERGFEHRRVHAGPDHHGYVGRLKAAGRRWVRPRPDRRPDLPVHPPRGRPRRRCRSGAGTC